MSVPHEAWVALILLSGILVYVDLALRNHETKTQTSLPSWHACFLTVAFPSLLCFFLPVSCVLLSAVLSYPAILLGKLSIPRGCPQSLKKKEKKRKVPGLSSNIST